MMLHWVITTPAIGYCGKARIIMNVGWSAFEVVYLV